MLVLDSRPPAMISGSEPVDAVPPAGPALGQDHGFAESPTDGRPP